MSIKLVKKALTSLNKGDLSAFKEHINASILDKVRKQINKKEMQLSKKLIESDKK